MRGEALLLVAFLVGGAPGGGEPAKEAYSSVRRLVEVSAETWEERVLAPHKGRVLVVNFWATFCAPCLEELPGLVRAWRGFEKDPVDVVLVSADFGDSAHEAVRRTLKKLDVPFESLLQRGGDPGALIDKVDPRWQGELPFTVVYDAHGRRTDSLFGAQDEARFAEAIRAALHLSKEQRP